MVDGNTNELVEILNGLHDKYASVSMNIGGISTYMDGRFLIVPLFNVYKLQNASGSITFPLDSVDTVLKSNIIKLKAVN